MNINFVQLPPLRPERKNIQTNNQPRFGQSDSTTCCRDLVTEASNTEGFLTSLMSIFSFFR